jgi:hypothetical protein
MYVCIYLFIYIYIYSCIQIYTYIYQVDREANTLIIIGTNSAIRSVRLMLDTQMEYVDKQIDIEHTEKKAREDLYAFKRCLYIRVAFCHFNILLLMPF